MLDIKSILGFRRDSPYQNAPWLDIHTPDGSIDMSQTDKMLFGIDNTGMTKLMMPGSGEHKFRGNIVREIPLKQEGGTTYGNQLYTPDRYPLHARLFSATSKRGLPKVHNGVSADLVMQKGGIKQAFNPRLAGGDAAFQSWYMQNTLEGQSGVPYTDKLDYDYYSFYRNGEYRDKSFNIEQHFPDTYKRPTHPTFSDESIYSVPGNEGGHWIGERYIPAKKTKMQEGGFTRQDAIDFLFGDDEEESVASVSPVVNNAAEAVFDKSREQRQYEQDSMMQLAMEVVGRDYQGRGDRRFRGRRDEEMPSAQNFGLHTTGGVNPYLQRTSQDLFGQFKLSSLGIWGDKAHQARKSDHNTGDAQDFGFDTPETANQVVNKLQTEAGDRNIKYIIFNGKIWNPSVSQDWRPYSGPNPHDKHIHVSYNR